MSKAREDLKTILDLLAEWRDENGIGYVSMAILEDGSGQAYTLKEEKEKIDIYQVCCTDRTKAEVKNDAKAT